MGITFNRWNRIIIWCSASIAFLFSLKLVFCGIGLMVLICDLTWLGLRKTSNANKRKKKKENATDEMFWNFIWTVIFQIIFITIQLLQEAHLWENGSEKGKTYVLEHSDALDLLRPPAFRSGFFIIVPYILL